MEIRAPIPSFGRMCLQTQPNTAAVRSSVGYIYVSAVKEKRPSASQLKYTIMRRIHAFFFAVQSNNYCKF
jgi:hypothetical protein